MDIYLVSLNIYGELTLFAYRDRAEAAEKFNDLLEEHGYSVSDIDDEDSDLVTSFTDSVDENGDDACIEALAADDGEFMLTLERVILH